MNLFLKNSYHNSQNGFSVFTLALMFTLTFVLASCTSQSNAPEDHLISEHGIMHKEGYKNPETNCISCHGDDLRGGSSAVSCFECHDKVW